MFSITRLTILCALATHLAQGTTLELLGMDELIDKSTLVVRGRVSICEGGYRGSMIYTQCTVEVLETMKGAPSARTRFSVPGGRVNQVRQSIAGAPQFQVGSEYVLFLWTGASGFTQILGLSQGKFDVRTSGTTQTATRESLNDVTMLDGMGEPVQDAGVRMTLSVLRQRMSARANRSVAQ